MWRSLPRLRHHAVTFTALVGPGVALGHKPEWLSAGLHGEPMCSDSPIERHDLGEDASRIARAPREMTYASQPLDR